MTLNKIFQAAFGAGARTLAFAVPGMAIAQNTSPKIEYYFVERDSIVRNTPDGADRANFAIKGASCVSRALKGNDPAPEQNQHIPFRAANKAGVMEMGFIRKDVLVMANPAELAACLAVFTTAVENNKPVPRPDPRALILPPEPERPKTLNNMPLEPNLRQPYYVTNAPAEMRVVAKPDGPVTTVLPKNTCVLVTNNSARVIAEMKYLSAGKLNTGWAKKELFVEPATDAKKTECEAAFARKKSQPQPRR